MNENEKVTEDTLIDLDLELRYTMLRQVLLDAAADCDQRGHAKAVSEHFRDAADICERAGTKP